MTPLARRDGIDLDALRRGRHAKVVAAMARAGIDAGLFTKAANVEYATGATARRGESSLDAHETTAALVTGAGAVHLFTHYPDRAATEPAPATLADGFALDAAASVAGLVDACRERAGAVRRLAVDRLTAPLAAALRAAFGDIVLEDA